ncbi:hypothetical protein Q5P01_025662 [Channa striata]|uniref:B-cell receptor CD22 n=1 Tax=Channa striata TaxID=64152 RepID=A0AA88LM09_CHASR|nr:hypothetical protein Q5P01_025662 [Channa striata]
MRFTAAAAGFGFLLLSLTVVQAQNDWGVTYTSSQICAVEGSTVDISCTFRYPDRVNGRVTVVQKSVWFTRTTGNEPVDLSTDSEYAGRVQNSCNKNSCSLRITDLRKTDSAEYKFVFMTNPPEGRFTGSPGVTLSVTGVKDESCYRVTYTHRSICAFRGSSVDISCSYYSYYKVKSKFWFRSDRRHQWQNPSQPEDLSKDSQYSGRVQVSHTETGRSTLTITDLRETDSAQYHFTFRTRDFEWTSSLPGTTLTVTDVQVQVINVTVHPFYTKAELKCHSSCSPAGSRSYVWFKNGEKNRTEQTSVYSDNFYPGDTVYCAFKGHETHRSPSVYPSDLLAVSVSPSGDIVEGSSVTLTCRTHANPAVKHTLYKGNQSLPLDPGGIYHFTSISSEDRGTYYCKSEDQHSTSVFIDVQYPPKVPSVSVSPSAEIVEGSSVTLTCSSDSNPAANYTCGRSRSSDMRFTAAAAGFGFLLLSLTVVQAQNDWGVTYTSSKICAVEGSTVDISCTFRYPDTVKGTVTVVEKAVWITRTPGKKPVDLSTDSEYAGRVKNNCNKNSCSLRITDLRKTDSAEYKFVFITNQPGGRFVGSPGVTLSVRGFEQFPSPSVCVKDESCYRVTYTHRSICAFRGSSVDISCFYYSYYDVKSKFWFRSDRRHQWQNPSQPEDLSKDSQYSGRVQVSHTETGRSTLTITDLRETDSAQYHFTFRTRGFEWTSSLPGTTLTVTDVQVQMINVIVHPFYTKAELKCHSSCSPAGSRSYVWFKNGEKNRTEQTSIYSDNFYPGDTVYCAFKGHETHRSPSVYPSDLPSVSVSPSGDIVEGSSVTLTCRTHANPAATDTLYKGNQPLPLDPGGIYHFTSISSEDRGTYYCKSEAQNSTSVFIDVQYPPKVPSVSVSPSAEIVEGSSVTLTCSSDSNPAANYTWYKENEPMYQGLDGIYHFTSISSEDRGIYYCKSENPFGWINSSSLLINVLYPPKVPSVSVSPSAEIVEGRSVTLTCSSDSNPAANYTWYKGNEDSPKASGQIFTITDFRPEHSGNYSCEAQNTIGRQNSTLQLTLVTDKWKIPVALSIAAVVLALTIVFLLLWIRREKSVQQHSEAEETSHPRGQQEDEVQFASVQFKRRQPDALYCNFLPAQRGQDQEGERPQDEVDGVQTSREKRSQAAMEDPFVLYSTVRKVL